MKLRFQFRLRTMLIVVTLICVGLWFLNLIAESAKTRLPKKAPTASATRAN